jgi:hypothetical protein
MVSTESCDGGPPRARNPTVGEEGLALTSRQHRLVEGVDHVASSHVADLHLDGRSLDGGNLAAGEVATSTTLGGGRVHRLSSRTTLSY